jgi:hypothetical protein
MKFSVSSSIKLAIVVLGMWSTSASAVPLGAWTSNPLYFDVNSLGAGITQTGNITLPYYKVDFPATESGPGAAAIDFTLSPDGNSALFTWTPQGSQSFSAIALKQATSYTIWNTAAVNWALYTGFYVTNTQITPLGISHITMDGASRPPGGPGVPDGGSTVALMGAGLALLAFARRKLV